MFHNFKKLISKVVIHLNKKIKINLVSQNSPSQNQKKIFSLIFKSNYNN